MRNMPDEFAMNSLVTSQKASDFTCPFSRTSSCPTVPLNGSFWMSSAPSTGITSGAANLTFDAGTPSPPCGTCLAPAPDISAAGAAPEGWSRLLLLEGCRSASPLAASRASTAARAATACCEGSVLGPAGGSDAEHCASASDACSSCPTLSSSLTAFTSLSLDRSRSQGRCPARPARRRMGGVAAVPARTGRGSAPQ